MKLYISSAIALALTLISCGDDSDSIIKETWNEANHPNILLSDLGSVRKMNRLPLEGELHRKPWSGDYWPTYKGGISYRWMNETGSKANANDYAYPIHNKRSIRKANLKRLSPAEKFDLYREDLNFTVTTHERQRTKIMNTVKGSNTFDPSFKIPRWEGLCHAWAPATIAYDSPNPVSLRSVNGKYRIPFGASDIKALLTFFVHTNDHASKTYFLGERCDIKFKELKKKVAEGEISQKKMFKEMDAAHCRGVNAGAFHIVLANQIGLNKQSFIADVTRDFEVWNQAIEGYRSVVLEETRRNIYAGAAKKTRKIMKIRTEMNYTSEIKYSFKNTDHIHSTKTMVYKYYLELDGKNRIIGGKWISDERPDFIWKQDLPQFDGFFRDLQEIYQASRSR